MTAPTRRATRQLGIFAGWRLQAYGYGIVVICAVVFVHYYLAGAWIVDGTGSPIYTDFTNMWIAGVEALHGNAGSLYDPAEHTKFQDAIVGTGHSIYANWPYPPLFLLILAPLATLPYAAAFLVWDFVTLAALIAVVYLIIPRRPAVALVLASPFTVWNFFAAHNGFLTAALLGASLVFLERRPRLAGLFIGCLTYKPQFGILLPVALAASCQWRVFLSAAGTVALLAGASTALFGVGGWVAFPRELLAQTNLNLLAGAGSDWGYLQTVYGLIRTLRGGGTLAWLAQWATAAVLAAIVWLVWRSFAPYALKAATLSAAALIATPYAFSYDLAAIAIPAAFLARDQMCRGFLRGEQTVLLGLFGSVLGVLAVFRDEPNGITFGSVPLGPLVLIILLGIVLRRAFYHDQRPIASASEIL